MFQFFALVFWLVAYGFGGPHWRSLLIHFLSDGLRPIRSCHFYWSLPGCRCDFSYWHGIALLLFNPVVLVNYGQIGALLFAFIYAVALIVYQFVCYCMFLYLLLHFSYRMWHIAKRYNRGSIVRHSFYFLRCYIRDLLCFVHF